MPAGRKFGAPQHLFPHLQGRRPGVAGCGATLAASVRRYGEPSGAARPGAELCKVKIEPITIGGHTYQIRSLLDRDQFYDPDGLAASRGVYEGTWSYFGVVWAAGLRLAEFASEHPLAGKRILEVGCGLALAGLVCNRRGSDITVSDRHPLAAEFLLANLALNALPSMPYVDLDWTAPPPSLGTFDLLIASDVMYEARHPVELGRFVDRHLAPGGEIVVVDAGRGGRGRLGRELARLGLAAVDTAPQVPGPIRLVHYALGSGSGPHR